MRVAWFILAGLAFGVWSGSPALGFGVALLAIGVHDTVVAAVNAVMNKGK